MCKDQAFLSIGAYSFACLIDLLYITYIDSGVAAGQWGLNDTFNTISIKFMKAEGS